MQSNKNIYDLSLHESTTIEKEGFTYYITRVASGWLYRHMSTNVIIFVPFDNKFQV